MNGIIKRLELHSEFEGSDKFYNMTLFVLGGSGQSILIKNWGKAKTKGSQIIGKVLTSNPTQIAKMLQT